MYSEYCRFTTYLTHLQKKKLRKIAFKKELHETVILREALDDWFKKEENSKNAVK